MVICMGEFTWAPFIVVLIEVGERIWIIHMLCCSLSEEWEGKEGLLQDIHGLECKQSLRTYWTSTCFLPLLVKQSPKLEYLISVPVMSINPIIRVGICTFISSGQGWWIPSRDLTYPTKVEKENHRLTSILGGDMLVPSEGLTAS